MEPYQPSGINLFSKRNIISFLVIGIMLAAIPVAVRLVKEQQQLKSKAASTAGIIFTGDKVKQDSSGNYTTTSPDLQIKVTSPFGPGP